MRQQTRYKDLLDYTITYRAAWSFVAFLIVLGVAGYLLWSQIRPPGEDEQARQEYKAAERLRMRAEGCLTADPETNAAQTKRLQEASERLRSARESLEAGDHAVSMAASREAADVYKDFIDKRCATRESVAEFLELTGDVKVKKARSERWVPARRDASLEEGDRVWALAGVARVVYQDGETQEIRENSIIEIKSRTLVKVEKGETAWQGVEGSKSILELPQDLAVEPGGDHVDVSADEESGTSEVRSRHGGAVARRHGEARRLGARTRIEATAETWTMPEEILPNPELDQPIDNRVFTFEKPEAADVILSWKAVPGAHAYRFRLGVNKFFVPLLNRTDQRVTALSVRLQVSLLQLDKQYFWQVAAFDAKGIPGSDSETRRFTVKRMTAGQQGSVPARPPPKVTITEKIRAGDTVIVKGSTDPPYVTLEYHVNGRKVEDVDVDDQGSFQVFVRLAREGKNVIRFVAHDVHGTEGAEEFAAYLTVD
jgi:hypothetical protein